MTRLGRLSATDRRTIHAFALAVFGVVVVQRAWVCDDAFISLRVVDNLTSGLGLVHNVGERVQGFTNPLWVLLLSGPYLVAREPFWTAIVVSGVVSLLTAAMIAFGVAQSRIAGAFAVVALACTQAFGDFSTGGLENPLSHLLVVAFLGLYLAPSSRRRNGRVQWLWTLAALLLLTRLDNVFVVAPALVHLFFWRSWRESSRRMLIGFAPLLAWGLFALVYYGSPIPNTAVAKLNADIPRAELVGQGVAYLSTALQRDPMTACLILMGVAVGVTRRRQAVRLAALGVALQIGYVVWVAGDFMEGRFLTVPLAAAVCTMVSSGARALYVRAGPAVLGFLVLVAVVSPHNPFHGGVQLREIPSTGIVSERGWYFDHLTLLANLRHAKYRSYGWWREGRALKESENRVAVHTNVGLFSFAAGPDRYVVDVAGLTDPLLARIRFEHRSDWRPGHFGRPIPAGYLDTLRSGRNVIQDPELRALYDRLRLVVRGPIGSWSRLAAIPWFILARYERPPAADSRK